MFPVEQWNTCLFITESSRKGKRQKKKGPKSDYLGKKKA